MWRLPPSETDRSKPRQTARIVTLITPWCLLVLAFYGQYLEPYRTPEDLQVLSGLLGLYVELVAMRRMSRVKPLPRLLVSLEKVSP